MGGWRDGCGRTPLINAVRGRDYTKIHQLLKKVSADDQDKEGRTALHYAAQAGFCLDILLAVNANVNLQDVDGNSPLILACAEGRCRLIRLLCEAGADVNMCNSVGMVPIVIMTQKGHVECVEVLVRHGANIRSSEQWLNICDAAVQYDRDNVISYLLSITGGDVLADTLVSEQIYSLASLSVWSQFMATLLALGFARGKLRSDDETIKAYLRNPLTLKQCSRLAIRSRLTTPVLSDVCAQLQLPATFGHYLALDYDPHIECDLKAAFRYATA